MASDPRLPGKLPPVGTSGGTHPRQAKWRMVGLAAFLISSLAMSHQVGADEFDPLVVYQEARPLNDDWQACAASFVRSRLHARQTPETLAGEAFDHCRAKQAALRRFFIARIGAKAAANVMMVLRDKYRAGLTAAIEELRARD